MQKKTVALVGAGSLLAVAGGYMLLNHGQLPNLTALASSPQTVGDVTGITVTPTDQSANVTWNSTTNAGQYTLQITDQAGNPSSNSVTINGHTGTKFAITGTSVQITGLTQNIYFTLQACGGANMANCGPVSSVQAVQLSAPGQVSSIQVTNITTTGFVASWSVVSGATSYTLQHTDSAGTASSSTITVNGQTASSFQISQPSSGNTVSVTFSNLYPGGQVHFVVRACNG